MTGAAPGVLFLYLLDAVLLTIPVSLVLIWLYRRSVERAMQAASTVSDSKAPVQITSRAHGPWNLSELIRGERLVRLRLVLVYLVAGARPPDPGVGDAVAAVVMGRRGISLRRAAHDCCLVRGFSSSLGSTWLSSDGKCAVFRFVPGHRGVPAGLPYVGRVQPPHPRSIAAGAGGPARLHLQFGRGKRDLRDAGGR